MELKHGHYFLIGFGAVIIGKILAAALAKYLNLSL
jgi:hypothetical protein